MLSELGSQSNPSASFPSIGKNGVMYSDNFSELGPSSDGIIAQWKFNGNSRDYGGSDLQNTVNGSPSFGIGLNGNQSVVLVDGDYYTFGDEAGSVVDFGSNDSFSLSAWVKTSYSGGHQRFLWYGGTVNAGWNCFVINTGAARLKVFDGTNSANVDTVETTIQDGLWHHIVATRDTVNDLLKIYLDGNYSNEAADSTVDLSSIETFAIARNTFADSDNVIGSLQDIRIYNKVLTAEEVNILYKMITDTVNTKMQLEQDSWYVSQEFKETL